ncbi:MAG TPA: NYN domain-containing protein, partial [Ktedonobacterales bacterium]|nr:NYN domain-containing protein [Ktedonobacterales bacterium]
PGYRQYRYLTIPTSLIAPISVYVDAENVLPEKSMPALISFLRKFLGGRRADLLYFMDAQAQASTNRYKTLYRFGFRPVDVPHNPTGAKEMYEAVDRELAMHAFERALVGPPQQEFIIISSDGDFAPLVYRLIALGHSVQIWSFTRSSVYLALAQYLPLTLVDLSQVLSEQTVEPPADPSAASATSTSLSRERRKRRRTPARRRRRSDQQVVANIAPPMNLTERGAEQLYYAIAETLRAHHRANMQQSLDTARNGQFHALLNSELAPRIASVGYSSGAWIDYWLDHLKALGVLISEPGHDFPRTGVTSAETAANHLYAMVKVVGDAALHATSNRPDGLLNMHVILSQLEGVVSPEGEGAQALRSLLAPENGRRATHVRYLVRCARALGVIQFDDVRSSLDLIGSPRVTPADETLDDASGSEIA